MRVSFVRQSIITLRYKVNDVKLHDAAIWVDLYVRAPLALVYRTMKPEPLFYVARDEHNLAGPYDLVQMAGLLRKKIITGDTMTRLKGEDDWKPFGWQAQFSIVREMPPDAVSTRVVELDEKAEAAKQGPIPLPSAETLMKLGGMILGSLLAGVVAYLIARLDATTGGCLVVAGAAAVLVAQCMIFVRFLDEDYRTWAFVYFVPFGDSYYFICNFWQYYKWILVKYVGGAVLIGAVCGLAAHSGH